MITLHHAARQIFERLPLLLLGITAYSLLLQAWSCMPGLFANLGRLSYARTRLSKPLGDVQEASSRP